MTWLWRWRPIPLPGQTTVEWLRWTLPPGAVEMLVAGAGQRPVFGSMGWRQPSTQGRARLPDPERMRRTAVLRVEPA